METGNPKFINAVDFMKTYHAHQPNFSFSTEGETEYVTVNWAINKWDYDIAMDRFRTPLGLLQWIAHMGQKRWPGMTSEEVAHFIEVICKKKGWDLWGANTA